MRATHYYVDDRGYTYYGIVTAPALYGGYWFLPLCDDGITWMDIPVCIHGLGTLEPVNED
jgi:hypothetical protein